MPFVPQTLVPPIDVLRQLALPAALVDRDRVAALNAEGEALLGKGVVGHPFSRLLSERDRCIVEPRIAAVFDGALDPHRLAIHLHGPIGSPIPVDLSMARVAAGTPAQLLAVFPPSAWFERRTALLEALDGHYRELVDAAQECLVVHDLDGTILLANLAAQEMTGVAEAELRRLNVRDFLPAEQHGAVRERAATRLVGSRRTYTYDVTVRPASGSPVDLEVFSSPVVVNGVATCVVLIGRDSAGSRIRAAELRNQRDAAEAASRAKSDFLARMSHEIRSPINVVFGMTEMALDLGLPSGAGELIERARGAARGLLALIDDLLDLSRIEAAKLALRPREIELRTIVAESIEPLRPQARARGLGLEIDVDGGVPRTAVGDGDRLRQVLVNLVTNAIKFTPEGGVTISLRNADTPQPPDLHLLFSVRDTGIGIPVESRGRIFEAFAQGDPTIPAVAGGVGLGLAIARELVSLMGGQIWVESEPGHGSTFHFTVRMRRPEDPA